MGNYMVIDGAYFKASKAYAVENGVYKKLSKAYVVGNNKYVRLWSAKSLDYYGTATALSAGRAGGAGVSIGEYALFGGGYNDGDTFAVRTVDAYDTSLTHSTLTNALQATAAYLAAAANETPTDTKYHHAIFAGGTGYTGTPSLLRKVATAYDKSLTRTYPSSLSVARYRLAAAMVGNYILFGGGVIDTSTTPNYSSTVDAYDPALTRTTPTALSVARGYVSAATAGNGLYALFAGGSKSGGTAVSTVDAYDVALTRTTPTALSTGRMYMAAASLGQYALFGGGSANSVDVYDASLTRTTVTALSVARSSLAATSVGEYAIFAGGAEDGGKQNGSDGSAVVDVYDTSLTRSVATSLSVGRRDLFAASIGDYALFAGGYDADGSYSTVVDAYKVTT